LFIISPVQVFGVILDQIFTNIDNEKAALEKKCDEIRLNGQSVMWIKELDIEHVSKNSIFLINCNVFLNR
jgi:hypothetical protein